MGRFRSARFVAPLLGLALLGASLGLIAPPAQAAVNDNPDETWVTNGDVYAVTRAGGRIYLGGTFDQVGPNTGYGVPLDPSTGKRADTFPKVNGDVYVAVPDGAGGWYIGGNFTRVGDKSRQNAARILADGTLAGWNPNTDAPVRSIVPSPSAKTVYIGGDFTVLRATTSPFPAYGLAATGMSSGAPVWGLGVPMAPVTPTPASVSALALSADGTRLYAGGTFTSLGGVSRSRLAAVDADRCTVDATYAPGPDGAVAALALSPDGRLFVGGNFARIAGATQPHLAALTAATGAVDPVWQPGADDTVTSLTLDAGGSRL